MTGPGGPGSGYAVGGRLVLTSAHVVARADELVKVFQPGGAGTLGGRVVWCGTPSGRDDVALVLLDDDPTWQVPKAMVGWGRMVTDRPGTTCQTWGAPDMAQRTGQPVEAAQLKGTINPGTGFAGNQYVMDLLQHPPRWSHEGTSPWGGLSGAAVFCNRLLAGVVTSDRAHSGHGQLNVIPAYVLHHDPAFRAALAEHGTHATGLEAVELQHLADVEPAGRGAALGSPAALLQAGRQTVPFHGRKDLLAGLLTGCGQNGFGAWLLYGPGGQGKTRLAHHLAALLAAEGWAVLWPRTDVTAAELRELRDVAKPLLVVLDYAEARTRQLTAIVEAAAHHPGTKPFKVLMLARTNGDWWAQAKSVTRLAEDYLDDAPSIRLEPLEQDPGSRPDAYRIAARALAGSLPDVRGLAGHRWGAAADTLPIPSLDDDGFANALTLQMTVLADLLDTTTPGSPGIASPPAGQVQGVEDRLLGHERRHWQHGATAHGLNPALSRATLETTLAAAHLVGAADREQADRTWSRIPALADQPRDRRNAVTAWITALYPPSEPGRPWGALQPDRLAERHVGNILAADPNLAERLIDGADGTQATQLLTVYSRAAAHSVFDGRLDTHLTSLCVRHHDQLAPHIIAIAIQADHPQPLITALDALTTDPTTAVSVLTTLHDQLPHTSRRLARTAVQIAEAITAHYRALAEATPDAYLPHLATALNNLSVRLGEAGRRAEGLTAIEEAVGHYRALAEATPDAYLPHLATALNNLSVRLGEAGRRAEGLTAIEETVTIRRALAEATPDAYLPNLATALNNLSVWLGEAGRGAEGLTACEEAVGHYRALAEATPDAYLPNLAMALNNLSVRLGEAGRGAEGLTAIEETVGHYRALAEATPDAYLPNLATALNNLSVQLGEAGRGAEALTAIEETVGHYRALAEATPDAHLPNLATALNNLSVRLGEAGRSAEALTAIEETVTIRRALAEATPDAYLPHLAMALNNLSIQLGEAGRGAEVLTACEETVGHYRALAEANPDAHLPHLAMALNNLSVQLGEAGRGAEALTAIEETVGHYRALAEANPDAHLPQLAMALNNLSNRLGEAGRGAEGLTACEETVGHYRALAEANPDAHLPHLATALNNLSIQLGEAERSAEALTAIEETVTIRRALAEANPDAHLPHLAMALNNLSIQLGEAERSAEALTAIEETVTIRRALAEATPDAHLPNLARALNNLSIRLGEAGRRAEALTAIEETVGHYRALAEANPERFDAELRNSLEVAAWLRSLPD
ncbi:tetratricopeptide repeat protein [Streptomyces rubiginosohelvolus]|uniref:tetratricopeptide repeat protein n=1 Tax=Streptomyces rubiginosohelvolus TaxID=67362 RepID=UPI003F91FD4C